MEALYGYFSEYFIYLWFLVVLGVVVFVHELGHYLVGRWCGIDAEVFSLGFGRELFGWYDKRGTRWRISLLPLGGYVKFLGDADASSRADKSALESMDKDTRARSFHGAAIWKRALAVAAGPAFNFVFSILVFALLAMWFGRAQESNVVGSVVDVPGFSTGLKAGDRIVALDGKPVESLGSFYTQAVKVPSGTPFEVTLERDGQRMSLVLPTLKPPLVADVSLYSAAWRAGLQEGDLITAVDGQPITDFSELQKVVLAAEGRELAVTYLRGEEEFTVPMTPKITDVPKRDGGFEKRVLIGVAGMQVIGSVVESQSLPEALQSGTAKTWQVVTSSISGLVHIISGDVSAQNLQGPIGIAQMSGEMAKLGLDRLITLVALISTAIGLLNLFPIPVLDGGHLVFLGIEAVSGRPPEGRWVEYVTALGLAMVLLLMLFATYNDVLRLIGLA